jgi:hypothetical protein
MLGRTPKPDTMQYSNKFSKDYKKFGAEVLHSTKFWCNNVKGRHKER